MEADLPCRSTSSSAPASGIASNCCDRAARLGHPPAVQIVEARHAGCSLPRSSSADRAARAGTARLVPTRPPAGRSTRTRAVRPRAQRRTRDRSTRRSRPLRPGRSRDLSALLAEVAHCDRGEVVGADVIAGRPAHVVNLGRSRCAGTFDADPLFRPPGDSRLELGLGLDRIERESRWRLPQEYWRCRACAHVGAVYTFKLVGGGDLRRDPPRRRCPRCGRAQLQDAYERMRPGDETPQV